ncbi:hypothetical protein DL96DRAFT_1526542 [Flagelloscypha sp. PMI_526]|nr:hypothetical protein DL96DRAFT_1526542 [Flagelloscypha sp. PMI_526]
MSKNAFCRFYAPANNTQFVLDGSTVDVLIADVHASVEISQRFTNPLDAGVEGTYTFGLLASAAICGFKMVRADGTEVEGVVKEKEEAKKEYQEAVKQGYTAALGAEDTKDVFSISVGNIAAKETVLIKLRYLQTLTDDEKRDQVRFVFPRTYAQRYGSAPTASAASASTVHQRFSMNVIVQQASTIKSISCPSGHPMQLELGKPDGFAVDDSVPDSQLAKVVLSDPSGSLTQDILLVITAAGLDGPRCFVEAHPSTTSNDTVAMGLTFVPRFKLPDHPAGMEYIFMVDRSGSMAGSGIKLVKEALVVLLRGLPSKGTQFNIVSFGSRCTKFWESSLAYTQSNLEAATSHVDSMNADYGGTEIASALDLVFSSLSTPLTKPVAVFLLTDGGAWDVDGCVTRTKNAITQQATKENFMRVFTVGIGNGVSINTCDSIAKAGGAISVYVGPNEPVVGKCSRLVRAARTPPIQDLQILWTGEDDSDISDDDDFEMVEDDTKTLVETSNSSASASATTATPATISLFDSDSIDDKDVGPSPIPAVQLPPPSTIQQAPLQPQSLFPGTRSQLYAILAKKHIPIPNSIKVKGTVTCTGAVVELDVPVCRLAHPQGSRLDFLHVLAAKALISDRENQIHHFSPDVASSFKDNDELRDAYLKADIVRLGVKYGLSSRHTSFVAVDKRAGQIQAARVPVTVAQSLESSDDEQISDITAAVEKLKRLGETMGKDIQQQNLRLDSISSKTDKLDSKTSGRAGRFVPPSLRSREPATFGGTALAYGHAQPAQMHHQMAVTGPTPAMQASPTSAHYSPTAPRYGSPVSPPASLGHSHASQRYAPTRADEFFKGAAPLAPPPPSDFYQDSRGPFDNGSSSMASSRAPSRPLRASSQRSFSRSAPPQPPVTSSPSAPDGTLMKDNVAQMSKGSRLVAIARLQQFDGRFDLSRDLLNLLGVGLALDQVQAICTTQGLEQGVVATALAYTLLVNSGEEEALDMQEKALEWLGDQLGDENAVASVVGKVGQLITIS